MLTITTTKITSKGQITLPKEVREFLDSDIITFEIKDNNVMIKPINSVGASLKKYNKNIKFDAARKAAWNEIARDYEA